MDGKKIIGLVEKVIVESSNGNEEIYAKIDTGATKSSIDMQLSSKLKLGPIKETKLIKSASGNTIRAVIQCKIVLSGRKIEGLFTLADRRHMKFKVLIGQNILEKGFLIDPSKNTELLSK